MLHAPHLTATAGPNHLFILRILVLLLLMVATPYSYAQRPAAQPELPRDLVTGKVSYRRIVVVEGVTGEQLYGRALAWLAQHNHTPTGSPPLEDEVQRMQRRIIARGEDAFSTRGCATATVSHTLHFDFKDGRFQYEFTDFSERSFRVFENDRPVGSKRTWNRIRTATDVAVKKWEPAWSRP